MKSVPVLDTSDVNVAREHLGDAVHPLVVVPVFNAYHDVLACLESLFRFTSVDVPILIVDDAGGDARAFSEVLNSPFVESRSVTILRHHQNTGFVGSCNDGFVIAGQRDVVLVNSDIIVGPEWLDRLSDAAYSSNLIATASTLTNHGTLLSVPHLFRPTPQLPQGHTPESAAIAVAEASSKNRPTIPTAVGHCVYIKRAALNLVGNFDSGFGRGYGEEVDFSQRCVELGFRHVCADDVFTFHRGGGSFGVIAHDLQNENEKTVVGRYPWYRDWVWTAEHDKRSALLPALVTASVALRGMTVAIDARALGPELMGTQQVIIDTIKSLASHSLVSKVVAYVTNVVPLYAQRALVGVPVEFVNAQDSSEKVEEKCDIAYRPYQMWDIGDIEFLRKVGCWTVVNQLDFIAFSNPSYFANVHDWLWYRSVTRAALDAVDGIAYLSTASQNAAHAEGLGSRASVERVVYTSAEFTREVKETEPSLSSLGDRPFILVLGATYLHKNRPFALALLEELRDQGWDGDLVMAGATPPAGSSIGMESRHFLRNPELRDHVHALPAISDTEKAWLLNRAALVLYPTISEGFGLVPFEAAVYGRATVTTRQGSLDEVLPQDIPTLASFDLAESAELVMRVLKDDELRSRIVSSVRESASQFSLETMTESLMELFQDTLRHAPTRVSALVGEDGYEVRWSTKSEQSRVEEFSPGGLVRLGWRMSFLKRLVSPEGSRRQEVIRATANWLRSRRT